MILEIHIIDIRDTALVMPGDVTDARSESSGSSESIASDTEILHLEFSEDTGTAEDGAHRRAKSENYLLDRPNNPSKRPGLKKSKSAICLSKRFC